MSKIGGVELTNTHKKNTFVKKYTSLLCSGIGIICKARRYLDKETMLTLGTKWLQNLNVQKSE